jgi:hypothetical protein
LLKLPRNIGVASMDKTNCQRPFSGYVSPTESRSTLKEFLAKIEKQYGNAKRTWVMDRGFRPRAASAAWEHVFKLAGRLV